MLNLNVIYYCEFQVFKNLTWLWLQQGNSSTHTPHTHVQSQKYGMIPLPNTIFKQKRATQ